MAANPVAEPGGFPRPIDDRTLNIYRMAATYSDGWPWTELTVLGILLGVGSCVALMISAFNGATESVSIVKSVAALIALLAFPIPPIVVHNLRTRWKKHDLPKAGSLTELAVVLGGIANQLRGEFQPKRGMVFVEIHGPHQLLGVRQYRGQFRAERIRYYAASEDGKLVDVDRFAENYRMGLFPRLRRPKSNAAA